MSKFDYNKTNIRTIINHFFLKQLIPFTILCLFLIFDPTLLAIQNEIAPNKIKDNNRSEKQLIAQNSKIQFKAKHKGARIKQTENDIGKLKNNQSNPRLPYIVEPSLWYMKLSNNINYYNLGSEFNQLIGKIEGMFSGTPISTTLMTFDTSFKINSDLKIERASTNIIPTGNIGFGYIMGKHQFEIDLGLAGLVPLNTVNASTEMTLQENTKCVQATINNCPLAKLGFVDLASAQGRYSLDVVMNEQVWLVTPSFYYDYTFLTKKWGSLSAGSSLGLVILSARQNIIFSSKRLDPPSDTGNISDKYKSRRLEGVANSTAANDIGPIARLYMGIKMPLFKGLKSETRIGVSYGFVNLERDVDGAAQVFLGDALVASFPTSALGFKNHETNKFELMGVFIQLSIVF